MSGQTPTMWNKRLACVKSMLAEKSSAESMSVTDVHMPQRGEWPEHVQGRMTYRRPVTGGGPAPPQRSGMWELYNSPALLLFGIHEQLAVEYACFDLELLVENVCLAAHARGLGTCIMAMAVRHADALHELLPEAAGRRFVVGVALGHPDLANPLNQVERTRCPFGEVASFIS